MTSPLGKFIAVAHYYTSETAYAFGPFTQKQLERFIQIDPTPESHEEWQIIYVNLSRFYGNGDEISAYQ